MLDGLLVVVLHPALFHMHLRVKVQGTSPGFRSSQFSFVIKTLLHVFDRLVFQAFKQMFQRYLFQSRRFNYCMVIIERNSVCGLLLLEKLNVAINTD